MSAGANYFEDDDVDIKLFSIEDLNVEDSVEGENNCSEGDNNSDIISNGTYFCSNN